jgi:hypothetical protein
MWLLSECLRRIGRLGHSYVVLGRTVRDGRRVPQLLGYGGDAASRREKERRSAAPPCAEASVSKGDPPSVKCLIRCSPPSRLFLSWSCQVGCPPSAPGGTKYGDMTYTVVAEPHRTGRQLGWNMATVVVVKPGEPEGR